MKSSRETVAVIPAAGTGSRLGLDHSKGVLPLLGHTIIEEVVRRISSTELVSRFVIAVRPEDRPQFEKLNFGDQKIDFVQGGAERQSSVCNALTFIEDGLLGDPSKKFVLIHDAARCLVSPELVQRSIEQAFEYGAVTAAIPSSDSVKEVSQDGTVLQSLDRSKIWLVQTPQVFRFDLILRAHRAGIMGATDDASMVETLHPVKVVMGERTNIKITTEEDYAWAKVALRDHAS